MNDSRPQSVLAVILGALLAILASCGVYSAAQPSANTDKSATFDYTQGS